jgi:hypothetical protein
MAAPQPVAGAHVTVLEACSIIIQTFLAAVSMNSGKEMLK